VTLVWFSLVTLTWLNANWNLTATGQQ